MNRKIIWFGIITSVLNLVAVSIFAITHTRLACSIWEWITILGAPAFLIMLLELSRFMGSSEMCKNLMMVFTGCCCAITGTAHIINMTVTYRLLSDGVEVPTYFQMGYWPSTEMVSDFIAWGFFMGLAFIALGLDKTVVQKEWKSLKVAFVVCGILCLIGFFCAVFINDALWYIAPFGYGVGPIVFCVMGLRISDKLSGNA